MSRTDKEIANVLGTANLDEPDDAIEVILQSAFGPCFTAHSRVDYFEVTWNRRSHEELDPEADIAAAVTNMARAVRLFSKHKVDLKGRPINLWFLRFRSEPPPEFYVVHFPGSLLRRAIDSPKTAQIWLANGYKVKHVAEGMPPLSWERPN